MKKILYISVLTFFAYSIKAQSASTDVAANLSQNNYVFEGIIENVEFYAGDKQGNKLSKSSIKWENGGGYFFNSDGSEAKGYSLAKIKLYKIYKGSGFANSDYVYLLSSTDGLQVYLSTNGKDSALSYMNFTSPHDDNFLITPSMVNYRMIFFTNKNQKNEFVVKNKSSVIYYNQNYSENSPNETDKVLAGIENESFKSYTELNSFLSKVSGVNVNAKEKFELNQKKSANSFGTEEIDESSNKTIDYQQNLVNYNKRIAEFAIRQANSSNKNQKKSSLATDVSFQIANPRLSGPNNAPRLDFDVLISSNVGTTYYDGALLRIIYNTAAFGSSVVANSNITITRAPAFNIPTYTNPQVDVIDQTANVIGVPFGSDFSQSTFNRVLVTTTPKLMLTFSIKINTCGQAAGVNFTDISFTPLFSFYTSTAGAPITSAVGYDNTTYSGNINDNTCTPIITSFNNNVAGGVNQILTITGKYFGPAKGLGTVIFKNADKGTTYPTPPTGPYKGGVQQYDVLKWTNDTIKINMPGVIDSTISGGVAPGTGKFQVYNRYNYSKESTTPLIIPYSVLQYPDYDIINLTYTKAKLKLSGNVGNGYRVQINNNIIGGIPNSKPIIRKAMKDWSCATGINWYLGNDTTAGVNASSNLCIIDTGNFSPLMQTQRVIRFCLLPSNKKDYYMKSFNIRIKPVPSAGPWVADSVNAISAGTYDFYSAISHELGHAHGVSHINDSIVDLMWWAGYATGYPANLRKLVKSSGMARTAAEYVADSLIGNLNCVGNHFTVTVSNCEDIIGIKKNFNDLYNISIAPNPSSANEQLKIKFNLTEFNNVNVTLFDITGKIISTETLKGIKEDEYQLNSKDIESGIYLLQISINDRKQSYKIIRQ